MTHRGPFQPRPFCDSVILCSHIFACLWISPSSSTVSPNPGSVLVFKPKPAVSWLWLSGESCRQGMQRLLWVKAVGRTADSAASCCRRMGCQLMGWVAGSQNELPSCGMGCWMAGWAARLWDGLLDHRMGRARSALRDPRDSDARSETWDFLPCTR